MDYRYQLENRLGKEKITCPECGHSETFTRFVDIITGELLSDEYGMCDRAYKCAYVNRPPQNYITDEPTEFNYSDNSIYDTGFIKENWTPENDGMNNSLSKRLVELFGKEDVLPIIKSYKITDFYDGGTIYPYTLSDNLISGKIIFYDNNLKRLKEQKYPDTMWLHSYHYTDNHGSTHLSTHEYCYTKKVYPLFGWDLIDKNPEKIICVVEGEKSAIICSIVFPEFLFVAAGALKWIQPYKFPMYHNRVWLFFPDLEPKQDGKNYYDYWNNQIKKIKYESGYKLKYSAIVDYTTYRLEPEYFENKGDIADILIDYRKWDFLAETIDDRMHGKLENYRKIILKKIYQTVETI